MTLNKNQRFSLIWISIATAMFLIQAATIDVVPSLMQDEAQITDYGRLALDPFSSWSVTWWVAADKPLLLWSYIGPVLAELGYQLGGQDGLGTRLIALIGGLVASLMTLGWLLGRHTPPRIAGLLALAFLLDPLFSLSQRMARTDSWVIACCIAACWLLVSSRSKSGTARSITITCAGMVAALAAFVWPSAFLLYPLIVVELFSALKASDQPITLRRQIGLLSYFITAGVLMTIILLLPLRHQLPTILDDMKKMVALNVSTGQGSKSPIITAFSLQPWDKIVKAFGKTLSLGIPALALWALIFKRSWDLLIPFLCTLAIIIFTLVYEFRVLYLLPYLIALSASHFRHLKVSPSKSAVQKISMALLVLVVVSSFAVSIVLRSAIAINDGQERDRKLINAAANTAIGPGRHNVFLAFTYEFYYTGRALGWQLYTPYIQFSYDAEGHWIRNDDFKPEAQFVKLLTRMDYAVFPPEKLNEKVMQQLEASGLHYRGTIKLKHVPNDAAGEENGRANQVFMWFLRGSKGYGPYIIYARSPAQTAAL